MRVIHVITRLIVGGAQENTIASVIGLRQKPGLEVHLISGPATGPEGSLEGSLNPELLTVLPSLVRSVHPWKDARAFVELARLFRKRSPDLVHTHSGKAGILGRWAARCAKIPCIVHTIHGPSFGRFQGALPNLLFRTAERSAAGCTTHFVSVAEAMTRQYLAAGIGRPDQFTRIYSGFALEPFLAARNDLQLRARWAIAPAAFVVGKIARFFNLKGHDDLLAAAPWLVKECPQIKFLLVGDGVLKPRFEKRVRELNLARHFVFTGLVPPADIPGLIGIMDALVHLSRREGLPRALPQALAAGRPVVACDCDGANEICLPHETGFLIQTQDTAGLVNSILALAADPNLRNRLGKHGQELVRERFALARMVEDLYALYQELLKTNYDSGP